MPFASPAAMTPPELTPDVRIEAVEVDPVEGFGQRRQRADLVDGAQRPAARQSKALGIAPVGHGRGAARHVPDEALRLSASWRRREPCVRR